MTEHALVAAFLRDFDTAATGIPAARRSALRAEIASHLHDQVSPDATDDEARLAILEFGTPDEIVAQESGAAPRRRLTARVALIAGAIVLATGAAATALVLLLPHGQDDAVDAATAPTAPPAVDSVVTAYPDGPERAIEGAAFDEYASEVSVLPALPANAEWPVGPQAGLNAGVVPNGSGVMEAGAGTWNARFTWLCAWEGEYLAAAEADDEARQSAARTSLVYWIGSDFWHEVDPEGSWGRSLLDSLDEGRHGMLQKDYVDTCMQAGILHVWHP